ncbi:MAG: DUF4878 domain-containing protein [Clostridia bacterium]|nr:DUF4878 domain-containing protein [Clostridia bacterium]
MKKILSLMILLVLLINVGCSSGPPPEKVVEDFLNAMIKGKFEKASELCGGTNVEEDVMKTSEDEQGERFARSILSKVTYEIGDKKVEGDKAEVNVKITAPDLLRITGNVMRELLPMAFAMAFSKEQSEEETNALFEQYFENAINDPNASMTTSEVNFILEKKEGSWVVVPNEELLNALTGNMGKAFAEMESGLE